MNNLFADRMATTHKSFIREILKVTQNSNVISFGGGLPNPKLFPVKEFADACLKVLQDDGGDNTLRLNFSNSAEEKIEEGIKRLAKVIKALMSVNK